MTAFTLRAAAAASLIATVLPDDAGTQSLARRIDGVRDGLVQFTFAARPGVCGNGRSYISLGQNSWVGSFNGNVSEILKSDPCEPGPVRVVLNRAGGLVVSLDTYVGPPALAPGARDLGDVSGSEAADYLLSLAATADGKPSRDAILPAMIAEGASTWRHLLDIGRDKARPRETRRSAIGWLARDLEGQSPAPADRIGAALVEIARDATDNQSVRQQAVGVLSRLDRGEGIPALVELARSDADLWLGKQVVSTLAKSGDPRARQFLRSALERQQLAEEVRVVAIRGLGKDYATSDDADFLRRLYPRLQGESAKDAVIVSLAEMGGTENVRWLLAVARSGEESLKLRRRALQSASKAGATTAELVGLYDRVGDAQLKETLIGIYAQSGDRAATDKLISIVRTEEDRALRRRTISRLSKSEDPRVRAALAEIVER